MAVERDFVGYGRNVPKVRWPGDARIAVNFAVNYEEGAERSVPDGDEQVDSGEIPYPMGGHRDLANETNFEYGSRVGVWRLLDIFAEHDHVDVAARDDDVHDAARHHDDNVTRAAFGRRRDGEGERQGFGDGEVHRVAHEPERFEGDARLHDRGRHRDAARGLQEEVRIAELQRQNGDQDGEGHREG